MAKPTNKKQAPKTKKKTPPHTKPIDAKPIVRTIQPKDIARIHGIKDIGFAHKMLRAAFHSLLYLRPGDKVETSYATFVKISDDLIQIDSDINLKQTVDSIESKKVLRIPV